MITKRDLVVILTISIILGFVACWKYILLSGYIFLAEQFEVYNTKDFLKIVYPLWGEKLQIAKFADATKNYLYVPVSFISFNSYKLLQSILLILPFSLSFINMAVLSTYFLRKTLKNTEVNQKNILFSAIISSIIYVINPWFIAEPRNICLRFNYAFMPLHTYFAIRTLEDKSLKYPLALGISLALVSSFRYLLIFAMMFLIYILIYTIIVESNFHNNLDKIFKFVLSTIVFLALSLGKYFPQIIYSQKVVLMQLKQFTASMIIRVDALTFFSTQSLAGAAYYFNNVYPDKIYLLFILVTAFSFVYLFIDSKLYGRLRVLLFPIVFIFFALFCIEKFNIFDSFLISYPTIGRVLRIAKWNEMPIVVSISLMTAYSIIFIYMKSKRASITVGLAILLVASIASYPFFTGDMNGYWRPSNVPKDYIIVNNMLSTTNESVIWIPNFGDLKAVWDNASTPYEVGAPMGIFDLRSSSAPSWWREYFYFFDYYIPINDYRVSPLEKFNNYNLLSKIYSTIGIKYLALHWDIKWIDKYKIRGISNDYIKNICKRLNDSKYYESVYKGKYVQLFKIKHNVKNVYPTSYILDLDGAKLTDIGSLSALQIEKLPAVLFTEFDLKHGSYSRIIENADYVIARDSQLISVSGILNDKNAIILYPASFTLIGDPTKGWAKTSVDSPSFQYYFWLYNIKYNWQFDYGKGLAFTTLPSHLNELGKRLNGQLLSIPRFKSASVFLNVYQQDGDIVGEVDKGNWDTWIEAESEPISVKELNYYKIDFKVKGENVIDFNAIVKYYINEMELGFDVLNSPISRTFNFTNVSSIIFTPPETTHIKIIFRVWQNPKFKSKWVIGDLKMYSQSKFLVRNKLRMPFEIENDDEYVILLRVLKSKLGGKLNIWLDDKIVNKVNTKSDLTEFKWIIFKEKIDAGKHEIAIENFYGFNAVNIVVIISKAKYEKCIKHANEIISNKTIIYILEPESDFHSRGCKEIPDLNSSIRKIIVNYISNEYIKPYTINTAPTSCVFIPKVANPLPICPPLVCKVKLAYKRISKSNSKITTKFSNNTTTIDYEFNIKNSTPVAVKWDLNSNWNMYDTVSVDVFGDGSNNSLSFWYYDNFTRKRVGIGQVKLSWVGWKSLKFRLNNNRTEVLWFRIVISWDGNIGGLGKHEIKVRNIVVKRDNGFELSRNITIFKDGIYTLAIRGSGKLKTYIGNNVCNFSSSNLSWMRCEIWLKKGKQQIRIVSPVENSTVDLIVLYSSDKLISKIFNNVSVEIIEYKKISPTNYIAKIRAKEPFMLAFTSGYDPFWIVNVDGTNYNSVPLYNVINGYYINKTGEYYISIEFLLQRFYDICLIISSIAFVISFVILAIIWGRER